MLLTGSDLGDRSANLALALTLITERIGVVLDKSEIIETDPWGFESETRFLNQAILVTSNLTPEILLQEILEIEKTIGRIRKGTQWNSRIIDIDILCSEGLIHQSDKLTIPHKFLHLREFALVPICQIMPNETHPVLRKSYKQLLHEVSQLTSITSSN